MNKLEAIQVLINGQPFDLYFKDEADAVIAEKDKEIQRLENLCESYRIDCDNLAIREANAYKEIERENKQLRHQKYKRCLAMAEICRHEWCVLYYERKKYRENPFLDHLKERKNRHREKWLELAEKFKEAK